MLDVNKKIITKKTYKPDNKDLESLTKIIKETGRTTILEFGVGYSTLAFQKALKYNQKFYGSLSRYRRNNPYETHSVDTSKKYILITKKRIKDLTKTFFTHSKCKMTTFNSRICHEYEKLPLINPDFIYLDGPHQFMVQGEINGISTRHIDMPPMSCDILKIESFLTPKTIIVVDGRAANARFLKSNLLRRWSYKYCKNRDQHFFLLDEEPFGKYSRSIINDIYYKKKRFNIQDL